MHYPPHSVPNVTLGSHNISSPGGPNSGSENSTSTGSKKKAGVIAGAAVGGVVVVAIAAGALVYFRRRRHQHGLENGDAGYEYKADAAPTPLQSPQPSMPLLQPTYPADISGFPTPLPPADPHASNTTFPSQVSKAEEAARNASRSYPSMPALTTSSSGTRPSLSATRSDTSSSAPFTPTEVIVSGLRGEMQSLRQQMDEMRAQREHDAPPQYIG